MKTRRLPRSPLRLALVVLAVSIAGACEPAWEVYDGAVTGCPDWTLGDSAPARLEIARGPLEIEGLRFQFDDEANATAVAGEAADALENDDGLTFSYPFTRAGEAFALSARLQRSEQRYAGELRLVDAAGVETRCTVDVEHDLVPTEPDLRPVKDEGTIDIGDKAERL